MLAQAINTSKYEVEVAPKSSADIDLCWNRLDNKSKKLTFMINQSTNNMD